MMKGSPRDDTKLKTKTKVNQNRFKSLRVDRPLKTINQLPSPHLGLKTIKSKRLFSEPAQARSPYCDYIYLIFYFSCLYTFYALFWYSLWMIYNAIRIERSVMKPDRQHNSSLLFLKEKSFVTKDNRKILCSDVNDY